MAISDLEVKLKKYYGDMLVYKSSANSKFFSALSLPSFMRDWLVMRFSDEQGSISKDEVSSYVKRIIPKKEQWNEYLVDLLHNNQSVRFVWLLNTSEKLLRNHMITNNTGVYNVRKNEKTRRGKRCIVPGKNY